jgi:hypothetical protein
MTNNISSFIESQIPEHLRASSPLFTGFMETYYKFVEQRANKSLYIQNVPTITDIDETPDEYILEFYKTYGHHIPIGVSLDSRNLIKLLNDVYVAKGTEKALKLIFRAIYNEEIKITYPSENILRASDGKWERESFITLDVLYGSIQNQNSKLEIRNSFGIYSITTTRVEYTTPSEIRCYFKSSSPIKPIFGDAVNGCGDDGVVNFSGKLKFSPSQLRVISGGNSWQRGQVIIIPGSVKNTIARITDINNGAIEKIEILEYGYGHADGQTITISPYANKPMGSVIDMVSTLVSINPDVYHHTIGISDYTDGVYESVIGVSDSASKISYFLEDYVSANYSGYVVFSQSSTASEAITNIFDAGVTITEWISSRATIHYTHSLITNTKGYYSTDDGKLSNQEIKTQDSYFYQAFSYLVDSTRNMREYDTLLNITHPAGTKIFGNLIKENILTFDFGSSRNLSADTIYHLDISNAIDSSMLEFIKNIYTDTVSLVDTKILVIGKSLLDSTSLVDSTTMVATKYLNVDSVSLVDTKILVIGKSLLDSQNVIDLTAFDVSKSLFDSQNVIDLTTMTGIKYLNVDSVSASSSETVISTTESYDSGSYFFDKYATITTTLDIGN